VAVLLIVRVPQLRLLACIEGTPPAAIETSISAGTGGRLPLLFSLLAANEVYAHQKMLPGRSKRNLLPGSPGEVVPLVIA